MEVTELCKDLELKMETIKTRQSRRDQFMSSDKPEQNGDDGSTHHKEGQDIYIGNLPLGVTSNELKSTFKEFDPIKARVLFHGKDYSYGFVRFTNMTKAKAAVMAYNGVQFKGNQLSIRLVRDRSRARIMEEGVQHGSVRDPNNSLDLHVDNIALDVTKEEVTQLFVEYGGASHVKMRTKKNGQRQYARVTMRSETLLQQAIREVSGTELHHIAIIVDEYKLLSKPPQKMIGNTDIGGHKHHQPSGEAHLSAKRLIQKIEVLSSEVLDSCAFCQRLQHLIHELQEVLNGMD